MKLLPIQSCSKCPFHIATPYPTRDSFERPEYWWCTNPNVEDENHAMDENGEKQRIGIKSRSNLDKVSYVAGYVEWNDKTKIPDFCPLEDQK